jgi:hypothetical protein
MVASGDAKNQYGDDGRTKKPRITTHGKQSLPPSARRPNQSFLYNAQRGATRPSIKRKTLGD